MGGPFFRTFGFPEVGAISFPDPFRWLSVPPLAGLEGQGCGAVGGRGAEGWLLSALPQHPSSFQCSRPNAFIQAHLHQGGCSGGGHLGLRVLWSLLHSLLQASTAVCLLCGRPRGRGVQSLTYPISIALWTCLPSRWRPFSLCSCRCVRGTEWPPSI